MGTDTLQPATPQPSAAATTGSEIDAFFARVAASGTQPRLRTVTGTCQFDIAGAGTWRVALKDGAVTATETVVADCALIRAADLNLFDVAMWFHRAPRMP